MSMTDYLSTYLVSQGTSMKENRYHRKSSCTIIIIVIISGSSIIIITAVTVIIIIILWSWPRFHAQCAASRTLSCDRDRQVPGP